VPYYYCYILECADTTYYTGWTTDPERRLLQHNRGSGSRYTRSRLPVKIVYLEPQPDRITAMKRERAIKHLSREKKKELTLTLILGASPDPLSSP
jgi:putative endonuclease